ncbi:glycosyl hydrolase [Pontibacter beigongshangensis]|uniref:glycosyl hydrolase n=1 Tax=Pontibacter beigongshangensis TaxID=2574733 RepID=UPI001650BD1A|nr:glycosyl hydrolase [Pontibacter beigongshangensis]
MNKLLTYVACLLLACMLSSRACAQKFEAENSALTGGASKVNCSSCSGGVAVAQGEGNLSFNVTLPSEGFYNLYLVAASPNGEKTNIIAINGTSADFLLTQNPQYSRHKVVSSFKLPAGAHTIAIRKSWGWINIDYLELEKVEAAERFNLNQTLVTPNPTPEAAALYDFLLDNYGEKIISGVMTLNSMDEVTWLKEQTGKEPALLGLDFMHSGRGYNWYNNKEPIHDARSWYNRNGIPALMWHWRDPSRTTEEFYVRNSSRPNGTVFDISKVSDPNSAEYRAMLNDIDYVAGLLNELQDQNVPVVWRPLHEAAGGWFWWGAKGAAPLKTLWQLMYDRMVNHHGLRNLIWVWTREPGDDAWYPGDNYVDIVGRDIYKDGDHSSHAIEFNNLNALYGGKKMIALSEVGSFPDADNLVKDGAAWSWYMPWYGKHTRESQFNPVSLWQKMFSHDYVITLDEMPPLRTYTRRGPTGLRPNLPGKSVLEAYPTSVANNLFLSSERQLGAVAVYNMLGQVIKEEQCLGTSAVISFAGLAPGIYLVRVREQDAVKVVKE